MNAQAGAGASAPAHEDGGADLKKVFRTFLLLAGIGLLSSLLYAVTTGGSSGAAAMFGSAVLVSGAFALGGGLVGFVFAIPRSRQAERTPQVEAADADGGRRRLSDYSANTNLEQISDWLTKILVGIGLIQFKELTARFDQTATTLAPLLGDGATARPAMLALTTYFSLWGFFVAYLLTRLWLPKALSRAEREEEVKRREAERDAEVEALERRAYDYLYEAPPGGFTRAIEAIEAYHAGRGSRQSPWLWVYLAAAYGQKHRYELSQQRPAAAEEVRTQVYAAVKQALELDSRTKRTLQQLYAGEDGGENDLASLKPDERLDAWLAG
jgi:hypothetical protein